MLRENKILDSSNNGGKFRNLQQKNRLIQKFLIIIFADIVFFYLTIDSSPNYFSIKNHCETLEVISCFHSMSYAAYFFYFVLKLTGFLLLILPRHAVFFIFLQIILSFSPLIFQIIVPGR